MIPLGLRASEQREFHQALRSHHTVKTTVQILNKEHKRISDVSRHLVSGEVMVLDDAETTRSASINLFDPSGVLSLEGDDPSDGAVFLNNMIRIVQSYTWPGHDGWVDVPVFCGPVQSVNRDAHTLAVEAMGKEIEALNAAWFPKNYGVNYVTTIIKSIMRDVGETRFDIPDLLFITTATTSLGRTTKPWRIARKLGQAVDRQLFYDGRGILRLRRLPKNPVWVFHDGERGTVTTDPRVSYDIENVRNIVLAKGAKVNGERMEYPAILPAKNQFSPQKLGRNGKWLVKLEIVENDHWKTERECQIHAVDAVNELRDQVYNVEVDSTPIPHLEPGDKVSLSAAGQQRDFRLRTFTIPLGAADSMPIGYIKHMRKGARSNPRPIKPDNDGGMLQDMRGRDSENYHYGTTIDRGGLGV